MSPEGTGGPYTDSVDELDIKGKKYISSKRAAEITGYAKDYIGQLARAGKIAATRFGRAWYVDESALVAHLNSESKNTESASLVPQKPSKPIVPAHFYSPYTFPKTWGDIKYLPDDAALLPTVNKDTHTPEIRAEHVELEASTNRVALQVIKPTEPQKRIRILEDGIIRRDAVLRVADPVHRAGSIKKQLPKHQVYAMSPIGVIPAFAVVSGIIFFGITVSGLFLSSGAEYIPSHEAYTASVLPSFEHFSALLRDSWFIQQGVEAFSTFVTILSTSFWSFFSQGIQFLKSF